jgi:hypothetical protein
MKRFLRPMVLIGLFGFSVAMLVTATARIKAFREDLPAEWVSGGALTVNSDVLKIVAGEFQGLMAEYLLLKAAIIDGGDREKLTARDWETIYLLYKQSLELDPMFYQTAFYVQGNIAWQEGMAAKAIDLLKISADNRSWDWDPPWYIGFDYANFLNDTQTAATYFFKAAEKPDAPPVFGLLAARLSKKGGDTLASIAMLKVMYEQTEDEETRKRIKWRIQAYQGVYQLEQAILVYEKRYGRLPDALEDLVTTGIVTALPIHPLQKTYYYDPTTGAVDYGRKIHQ